MTTPDRIETASGDRDRLVGRMVLASVIPIVTVAPALGALGTVARVLVAALAAVIVLRAPVRLPPTLTVLLVGLIMLLGAAAVGAPSLGYGAARLFNWTMFIPLAYVGAAHSRIRILAGSLIAACWLQVLGVGMQMTGRRGGEWGGLVMPGTEVSVDGGRILVRYTGFIGNPNDLGLLLGLGVLLCLVVAVLPGERRRRGLAVLCAAAFSACLVSTGSRGAIIATGLGLVITAAVLRGRPAGLLLGLAAVSAVLLVTRGGGTAVIVRSLTSIFSGTDISAMSRGTLWSEYVHSNTAWLLGNGFGGYLPSGPQGVAFGGERGETGTVDNGWLKLVLENGLLGALLLALLFIVAALPVVRTAAAVPTLRPQVAVCIGYAVAIASRAASADLFDINPWNAILWLLLGVLTAMGNRDTGPEDAVSQPVARVVASRERTVTWSAQR